MIRFYVFNVFGAPQLTGPSTGSKLTRSMLETPLTGIDGYLLVIDLQLTIRALDIALGSEHLNQDTHLIRTTCIGRPIPAIPGHRPPPPRDVAKGKRDAVVRIRNGTLF